MAVRPRLVPETLSGYDSQFTTHFSSWLRGLTPDQQDRFLERLEYLQLLDPYTGTRLQQRCAGLKSMILHGLLNKAAWGRSLLARRRYLTRLRNGHPLSQHSRRLLKWADEEAETQRRLGYRNG